MKTVGFITTKLNIYFHDLNKSETYSLITHRLKYDGKNINGEPVLYGGVPEVYAVEED